MLNEKRTTQIVLRDVAPEDFDIIKLRRENIKVLQTPLFLRETISLK